MPKILFPIAFSLISTGAAAAADLPVPARNDAFPTPKAESVLLGRDLFFDPILSGNRNISCATCHHPTLASGDDMSLSIGEGGVGLGEDRPPDPDNRPTARIPRNAPSLFNLGAEEFTALFHDGRVQRDDDARFNITMPEGFTLERPVRSVLAAQASLPITSHVEMAGQPGENDVADALEAGRIHGQDGVWQMLADRGRGQCQLSSSVYLAQGQRGPSAHHRYRQCHRRFHRLRVPLDRQPI